MYREDLRDDVDYREYSQETDKQWTLIMSTPIPQKDSFAVDLILARNAKYKRIVEDYKKIIGE